MTERGKKAAGAAEIVIFVLFSLLVAWFIGRPMLRLASSPEEFREWVDRKGGAGQALFVGMVVLQVIVALIPGEPLEIGAGYAFGFWEGTALCLLGIEIGSVLVFLFVKRFGVKVVEIFFSKEKIRSLRVLQDERKLRTLTFLLMCVPGTPKDLLSYFVGLTPMRLREWALITVVARIPSVVTSTIGGSALGGRRYLLAALVFGGTLLISLGGMWIYRRCTDRAYEE